MKKKIQKKKVLHKENKLVFSEIHKQNLSKAWTEEKRKQKSIEMKSKNPMDNKEFRKKVAQAKTKVTNDDILNMISLYESGKSLEFVSKELNIPKTTVSRWLTKYNKTRNCSQALIMRWMNPLEREKMSGCNSHRWKGGISPIYEHIRNTQKYWDWRYAIMKRDGYVCGLCGESDINKLQVHHVLFLSNLIKKYHIETIEDAIECDELWDINNGITYCETCHFGKIHKRKVNRVKCKSCLGYGYWSFGNHTPMGPIDAGDGIPTD
ncbi:MAG: hypothetical protein IMZ59_04720, partial [Actinobacteria bacterium]|nr:hypothetical protein [Actinomycetota bacterium]